MGDTTTRPAWTTLIRRPAPALVLLISVLVGCLAIFASLEYGARAVDAESRKQEEALIANAVGVRQAGIARSAMSVTLWDEAVEKVDRAHDAAWTQSNIIELLSKTEGFQLVYVLDGEGRMLAGYAAGADPAATLNQLRPAVAALTGRIRQREAARAPYPDGLPSPDLVSTPIDAATIAAAGGQTFLVGASLIQPDFGNSLPSPRAPIVIAGRAVDAAMLKSLASEYRVAPLALRATPPGPRSAARAPLRNLQGDAVGWLTWRARTPARELQGTLILPRILAVIFVLTVPFLLILTQQRQRRVLEDARRKAEIAAEAKSEFLANMSHEFRTPLTVIIGFGRILATSTSLAEKERSMVARINAASQTMLEMVNDVLDLARLESGEADDEAGVAESIDVATVAESAVALLAEQARTKGLTLTLDAPAGLPPVRAQAARLRQVLVNLIANAVKFTAQGGVSVRLSSSADAVEIAVSDTGIGISPADLDRIFERFAQAETTFTKRHGGTGLGLAISRRLVERMEGRLEVDSRQGEGSTFRVVLPRLKA